MLLQFPKIIMNQVVLLVKPIRKTTKESLRTLQSEINIFFVHSRLEHKIDCSCLGAVNVMALNK